jgi:hypothetical protein
MGCNTSSNASSSTAAPEAAEPTPEVSADVLPAPLQENTVPESAVAPAVTVTVTSSAMLMPSLIYGMVSNAITTLLENACVYAEPVLILLSTLMLRKPTGLSDSFTAMKDLLQGDGPIGTAVQRCVERQLAPTIKAALCIAGPLVVQVGEALPYVKEIIPILKTLVDMYREQGAMVQEYIALKDRLDRIQVSLKHTCFIANRNKVLI